MATIKTHLGMRPGTRPRSRSASALISLLALCGGVAVSQLLVPQLKAQAASTPRATGSVQAVGAGTLTISSPNGSTVEVAVPDTATVLVVPPGSTSLSAAAPAHLSDVTAGDKVLVTGTDGDTPASLHARRIIVMKAAAIAAKNDAVEQAWRMGGGGLVKSVAGNQISVDSGAHIITIDVTPATIVRRYAGDSVAFGDAVNGTVAQVRPGDQLRVRGQRSADGLTVHADEIVFGTFENLSGLVTAIDPAAKTVTVKDLATKKLVTVAISDRTALHRLPPQAAARFAARAKGQGVSSDGTTPGSAGAGASGPGGSARAGFDLSQMLARLPTETLGDLKPGDAVMMVASLPVGAQPTAITLLSGVEPILQASPAGEMTLQPWNVNSGGGTGGDAGGM